MQKPTDSFCPNHRARSGPNHSLPTDFFHLVFDRAIAGANVIIASTDNITMAEMIEQESVSWFKPTFWFVVIASVMGTNPFLLFIPALDIWLYSLLADVVFVGTMYASFRIPMELSRNQDELWKEVGAIYLTPVFVYVGFAISWLTLINTLMFGIEPEFRNFEMVILGYNGLWATLLYSLSVREKMIGPWRNGEPDLKIHLQIFSVALLSVGFLAFAFNGFDA